MQQLKQTYGDDVDVLIFISRTHYQKTLTTMRATAGAADNFLKRQIQRPSGVHMMREVLKQAWSTSVEDYYHRQGGRASSKKKYLKIVVSIELTSVVGRGHPVCQTRLPRKTLRGLQIQRNWSYLTPVCRLNHVHRWARILFVASAHLC